MFKAKINTALFFILLSPYAVGLDFGVFSLSPAQIFLKLHSFAVSSEEEVIEKSRKLLKVLDVNLKDENGWTALHYELMQSKFRLKVIKFLLDSGADPELPAKSNDSALRVLLINSPMNYSQEYEELTKLLIDKSKNINELDQRGNTLLMNHMCSLNPHQKTIQYLIEREVDIYHKNPGNNLSLMDAIKKKIKINNRPINKQIAAIFIKKDRENKALFNKKAQENKIKNTVKIASEIEPKAIEIQEKNTLDSICSKNFSSKIDEKFLNTSSNKPKSSKVEVIFSFKRNDFDDIANMTELSLNYFSQNDKKTEEKSLILELQAEANFNLRLEKFFLLSGERKTKKRSGTSSYRGVKTRDKNNKIISNISIFQGTIAVEFLENNSLRLKGNNNQGNFDWVLQPLEIAKSPDPEIINLDTNPISPFSNTEISNYKSTIFNTNSYHGTYKVSLNTRDYGIAIIDMLNEDKVKNIYFTKNGKNLKIKASICNDKLCKLIPQYLHYDNHNKENCIYKNGPGKATFEGQLASGEKTKKKETPICFQDFISTILPDMSIQFETLTNKGHMILKKESDLINIVTETVDREVEDIELTIAPRALIEPEEELIEFNQPQNLPNLLVPEIDQKPSQLSKKKKRDTPREYFDFSNEAKDIKHMCRAYDEKSSRYCRQIIQKAQEQNKNDNLSFIKLVPEINFSKPEVFEVERLNPYTDYESCPLFGKYWVGEGYTKNNRGIYVRTSQKIGISMKNLNDFPMLSHSASWASYFDNHATKQFKNGKNVHCSFHNQMINNKNVNYLNISHHGLFEIIWNEKNEYFELHQVRYKDNDGFKVFKLREILSVNKLKKEFHSNKDYNLNLLDNLITADKIEAEIRSFEDTLTAQYSQQSVNIWGDLDLTFYPGHRFTIYQDGLLSAGKWNINMINKNTASLCIEYINNQDYLRIYNYKLRMVDGNIQFIR